MAISWSRVADFAQRGIAVALFGLTAYGMVVLAQGGYGVMRRRRQRKALEGGGGSEAEKSQGQEEALTQVRYDGYS